MEKTPPTLPTAFSDAMQAQLEAEWPAFLEALRAPTPVSVRFHLLKNTKWQENYEGVKWCINGVYLPERPVFTLDPAFHAGAYYVQEASSMLIRAALEQVFPNPGGIRALDLAAAPGGKSTLLAEWLGANSLLLANEVIRSRYQVLHYNLTKWGYPNALCSNHDSQDFAPLSGWFDLALLDAPCSGEGLFRKDAEAASEWSPEHVRFCSARQRRILADTAPLLREGGVLLYSTCTYNQAENEENAAWIMEAFGFEHIPLHFSEQWGIQRRALGHQCYPHRVKGEGFYLAAFRKIASAAEQPSAKHPTFAQWTPAPAKYRSMLQPWLEEPDAFSFFVDKALNVRAVPQSIEAWTAQIARSLYRCHWGLPLGQIKGSDFIPSPELALSTAISAALPGVELDRQTALHYLKKEPVALPGAPNGWVLARHEGHNLGWAKVLANRMNNYYPKAWRILMDVSV